MQTSAIASKKACHEVPCIPFVLTPEVFEIIATYLQTSTDMCKLLRAIPAKYLTKALCTLEQMLQLKTLSDIEYYNQWCCPLQINRKLWPNFPLLLSMRYYRVYDAMETIFPLYSSFGRDGVTSYKYPFKYRYNTSLDHQSSAIDENIDARKASWLVLDTDKLLAMPEMELSEQWKDVILSPKLQTLVLQSKRGRRVAKIVEILKASETLCELDLSRFWIDLDQLTPAFTQDLAFLSRRLHTLKFHIEEITPFFISKFDELPEQLVNMPNSMLMFNYGTLSGIRLDTKQITQVTEIIHERDLIEFEIRCDDSEPIMSPPMVFLLELLGRMPSLRILRIAGFKLDTECCRRLATIIPRLRKCYLFKNWLDDDCGCLLAQVLPECTRLEHLSLSVQELSDRSAIAFANSIAQGTPLRTLDLSFNKIGNDGAIALSRIMTRLEAIKVYRNRFHYAGAYALSKVIGVSCQEIIKPHDESRLNDNGKAAEAHFRFCIQDLLTNEDTKPILPHYIGQCDFSTEYDTSSMSDNEKHEHSILGSYRYPHENADFNISSLNTSPNGLSSNTRSPIVLQSPPSPVYSPPPYHQAQGTRTRPTMPPQSPNSPSLL